MQLIDVEVSHIKGEGEGVDFGWLHFVMHYAQNRRGSTCQGKAWAVLRGFV